MAWDLARVQTETPYATRSFSKATIRPAFTLIELLVVIAILAILASLLLVCVLMLAQDTTPVPHRAPRYTDNL